MTLGDCSMCGKCCRTMTVVGGGELVTLKENYIGSYKDRDNQLTHILDIPCKHLDKKTNKCKIHDTPEYPERCKNFPIGEVIDWIKVNPACSCCKVKPKLDYSAFK